MSVGLLAGLVGLLLAACDSPGLVELDGVEPYEPLPEYVEFWAATEACAGVTGDLGRIEWFRATSIISGQRILRGLWQPPHRITIWAGLEDDAPTVRHEMLHDLLNGDPDHRQAAWSDCGLELRS